MNQLNFDFNMDFRLIKAFLNFVTRKQIDLNHKIINFYKKKTKQQNKNMNLVLKSAGQTDNLIKKFRSRQQEKQIEQALVYLKLKQFQCPTKQALIFAKRKQTAVDGTVQKDGPANFRKLVPLKPEGFLVNGWLRGQRLKYDSATSYNTYLKHKNSDILDSITRYNKQSRQLQQNGRVQRSKSLFDLNLQKPKQSIQKINSIKDNIMKQRENNNFVLKFKGIQLLQMTKFYSQHENLNKMDTKGLVVRAAAFSNCINDEEVQYDLNYENINRSAKSVANSVDAAIMQKRNQILIFKKAMDEQQDQLKEQQIKELFTRTNSKKLTKSFYKPSTAKSYKFKRSQSQIKRNNQLKQFDKKVQKMIKRQHLKGTSIMKEVQLVRKDRKQLKINSAQQEEQ